MSAHKIEIGDRVKFGYNGTVYYGRVLKINRKTYKVRDEKMGFNEEFLVDKSLCTFCVGKES